MEHRGLKLYKVCINDCPGLTLTYLTTRSQFVIYAFECGKLLQSHLIGKKLTAKDQFRLLKNPGAIYLGIWPFFSNIFFETAWPTKPKFNVKRPGGNKRFYKWSWSHDQYCSHDHIKIMVLTFKKLPIQYQKSNDIETWHATLKTQVLHSLC